MELRESIHIGLVICRDLGYSRGEIRYLWPSETWYERLYRASRLSEVGLPQIDNVFVKRLYPLAADNFLAKIDTLQLTVYAKCHYCIGNVTAGMDVGFCVTAYFWMIKCTVSVRDPSSLFMTTTITAIVSVDATKANASDVKRKAKGECSSAS